MRLHADSCEGKGVVRLSRSMVAAYSLGVTAALGALVAKPDLVPAAKSMVGIPAPPTHLAYSRTALKRKDLATPPGHPVFIGDSITVALPTSLVVDNAESFAIGGQTSGEILETMRMLRAPKTASIVFVQAGSNDVARKTLPQMAANYAAIMREIPPQIPVVVSSLPASTALPEDKTAQAAEIARLACVARPNCHFVDLYAATKVNGKANPAYLLNDGVHLSPTGALLWAKLLNTAMSERPLTWFMLIPRLLSIG